MTFGPDLEGLLGFIDDNATGIAVYACVQLALLAIMIAGAVSLHRRRSPVERILHKRHFGL